jgi:hypothetical protein
MISVKPTLPSVPNLSSEALPSPDALRAVARYLSSLAPAGVVYVYRPRPDDDEADEDPRPV